MVEGSVGVAHEHKSRRLFHHKPAPVPMLLHSSFILGACGYQLVYLRLSRLQVSPAKSHAATHSTPTLALVKAKPAQGWDEDSPRRPTKGRSRLSPRPVERAALNYAFLPTFRPVITAQLVH